MITKFLPWMVVTLTKIGNKRGADLGGVDDKLHFWIYEYVSNNIKHGCYILSVAAKSKCPSGGSIYGFGLQEKDLA